MGNQVHSSMFPSTCTQTSIPCLCVLNNVLSPLPSSSPATNVNIGNNDKLLQKHLWYRLLHSLCMYCIFEYPVLSQLTDSSEPNQCFLSDFLTGREPVDCFWIFSGFLTLLAWLVVNGENMIILFEIKLVLLDYVHCQYFYQLFSCSSSCLSLVQLSGITQSLALCNTKASFNFWEAHMNAHAEWQ